MNTFVSQLASTQLQRLPLIPNDQLRAWDAADELILKQLFEQNIELKGKTILLANDQFGALACQLAATSDCVIHSWSDSVISHAATEHNLALNDTTQRCLAIPSTQQPSATYDLILIKLPKTTALLDTQLNGLGEKLSANGQIIAAGMCKHMPKSTYGIFEKFIGPSRTSLAEKKARLIFAENHNIAAKTLPYPMTINVPELNLQLINHANVFSKEQLDIGARFFLKHFEQLPEFENCIDLGCGNGVLGIMAKRQQPNSILHFVDESYMAIESARSNYQRAFKTSEEAFFYANDSLSKLQHIPADLILCNPPFHQQHSVGEAIAKRMFKQSYQQLNNHGQLWVVANRHLSYFPHLKRLYKKCITVAGNNKFNIYQCIK